MVARVIPIITSRATSGIAGTDHWKRACRPHQTAHPLHPHSLAPVVPTAGYIFNSSDLKQSIRLQRLANQFPFEVQRCQL